MSDEQCGDGIIERLSMKNPADETPEIRAYLDRVTDRINEQFDRPEVREALIESQQDLWAFGTSALRVTVVDGKLHYERVSPTPGDST